MAASQQPTVTVNIGMFLHLCASFVICECYTHTTSQDGGDLLGVLEQYVRNRIQSQKDAQNLPENVSTVVIEVDDMAERILMAAKMIYNSEILLSSEKKPNDGIPSSPSISPAKRKFEETDPITSPPSKKQKY